MIGYPASTVFYYPAIVFQILAHTIYVQYGVIVLTWQ